MDGLYGAVEGGMAQGHGRERVPPAETEDMINRAIAEAATEFGVPATSIGKDRIRIALTTTPRCRAGATALRQCIRYVAAAASAR